MFKATSSSTMSPNGGERFKSVLGVMKRASRSFGLSFLLSTIRQQDTGSRSSIEMCIRIYHAYTAVPVQLLLEQPFRPTIPQQSSGHVLSCY